MLGETKAQDTLKRVLSMVEADQAEAILMGGSSALTRFANSTIHQNVFEKDNVVYLRVARGKKIGVATSNVTDDESLKALAVKAGEIAEAQVPNPHFDGFVNSERAPKVDAFFNETLECSPQRRAENVKAVVDAAARFNFLAAGSHSTSATEVAFLNTLGTQQYHRYTSAFMNTVIMAPTSSGYADASCLDIADLDPAAVGEEATRTCAESQNPREIEEGQYDVVITHYALESLMMWLSYIGFGADAFQDGRSFMSGNLGKPIMGRNISIWDDGQDPAGVPMPFDFEGVPKKRVNMIEDGVAKAVVYNTITAKKGDTASTGHALSPDEDISAMPINMFFSTGDSTEAEMIASMERGLFVRRFHYVNGLLATRKALFTGMTRDGTFLVENGKIKHPVKNLRFTHSMLDAFSNVEMITSKASLHISDWLGASVVPGLKIKGFNFSGKTEF
jgi:predicted Zn-dependent protease